MKQNIPSGIYTKISVNYIPLIDGCGIGCDNCGRPIANIVTVKHEYGKTYTIGQDCAKTIFSKQESESIAREIKGVKRTKERAEEMARQKIKIDALNELLRVTREAGLTNENINTQQGRDIWNHHLEIESAKVGFKISCKR